MAHRFLKKKKRHVKFEFGCEINARCQEVLRNTYSDVCCFPDIMTFDPTKKQFCTTHNKYCRVRKHINDSRAFPN